MFQVLRRSGYKTVVLLRLSSRLFVGRTSLTTRIIILLLIGGLAIDASSTSVPTAKTRRTDIASTSPVHSSHATIIVSTAAKTATSCRSHAERLGVQFPFCPPIRTLESSVNKSFFDRLHPGTLLPFLYRSKLLSQCFIRTLYSSRQPRS